MTWNWKENNKEKTLFRSYYCSRCKQSKPCGILGLGEDCCACYFQSKQESWQEYLDYQTFYQQEVKNNQAWVHQLKLLKD